MDKERSLAKRRILSKAAIKQVLGGLPFTAEMYWQIRQPGKPLSKSFSMRRTEKWLPEWLAQALEAAAHARPGRRVLFFTTLRYWTEHAVVMGLALGGLGHQVTLAYLPYANWRKPFNRFDLRRQNAYARHVLQKAAPLLKPVSFLDIRPESSLPTAVVEAVHAISLRDVQYTLQVEEVDLTSPLFRLRQERNTAAALAALAWLQGAGRPDVIVTPNGSILEMGAVYSVARQLGIPVVTYEFGEQRGRIWLARDAEVMRQETDALWAARGGLGLEEEQSQRIQSLFASRQGASLWQNFSRRWQGNPSQGGEQARQALRLDSRPVVLLAANVIGDSLTLGRQVFSQSMTEWLERTIQYFARRPDAQLVVRVHPGERYTQGPSVADLVRRVLPLDTEQSLLGSDPTLDKVRSLDTKQSFENIHLVGADDPVNTYDLVEIADLGLVYTTTVGMEMAMSGVPVIVAGQTHYRGKGFTLDPAGWDDYAHLLENVLNNPDTARLERSAVERAWNYAYRFFFEYPLPFPWHLLHFWNEFAEWPVRRVLSPEGLAMFGETFAGLAGEERDWRHTRSIE